MGHDARDTPLAPLLSSHRSIRAYRSGPVDDALVDATLEEALHGSSSSGNLNMVAQTTAQG